MIVAYTGIMLLVFSSHNYNNNKCRSETICVFVNDDDDDDADAADNDNDTKEKKMLPFFETICQIITSYTKSIYLYIYAIFQSQ